MRIPAFPKPTGEYAVGTTTYTVKDNRPEVLPAGYEPLLGFVTIISR